LINTIKKKLQEIFKKTGYKLYFLLYGKIEGVINSSDHKNIKIDKVFFPNNLFYRIFSIVKGRIYTDTVTDAAFIVNKKIVDEASFQHRNVKNVECNKNIVFEKGTPRFQKKLKGVVFSLLTGGGGNHNYWHWIFDVLPRIGIIQEGKYFEQIDYFLFPDIEQKFQKESLDILKIAPTKRLSSIVNRHVYADKILTVDHPYVINNDATKEIQHMPLWIIKWLRKNFLKDINNQNDLPKKFYIDRKDSISSTGHLRKIINEEEVKKFLEKENYNSLSLGDLSFLDQVRLFKNAESIIGLHGAGFANVVFSSPNTKILELKPSSAGEVIKNLSINNNLSYEEISIKPLKNDNNNQFGHIEIPLQLLKEKIN
jgi:capsular polysaccharide biosynthesis protein